ncbi:MAG: alpha-E domain-containing protein [Gammaproteobacteria bacterium]
MLSRVAERLYWMSRYLERAEDTARLVNAYSHVYLDMPKGMNLEWQVLVDIFDLRDDFYQRYVNANERNVTKFLLTNDKNTSSLRHSIAAARENMRTTREVLPAQAWELMNECYLFCNAKANSCVSRESRFEFTEEIIARNQQLTGLFQGTLLRDHTFRFTRVGRLLERADMTSRIIEVGAAAILESKNQSASEIPLLWFNLLNSLSAKSAYQRSVGPLLDANSVVNFIFSNEIFPRSIANCLLRVEKIVGAMNAPTALQRDLKRMKREFIDFDAEHVSLESLHKFVDIFQVELGKLHLAIEEHWFRGTAK